MFNFLVNNDLFTNIILLVFIGIIDVLLIRLLCLYGRGLLSNNNQNNNDKEIN